MINVISKRCIHNNCTKHPAFNIQSEKKALYCFEHKEENMINIISKRCIYDNCMKIPTFNLSTEKKALYCFEHKEENMIDVKSKRCIYDNCIKHPTFNLYTEKIGLYCSEHKEKNMIDVKSKRCIHDNCLKIPIFNIASEKNGLYCFEHKEENMINVKSNNCQYKKCKQTSLFGFINKRPQFCLEHKQLDMINLVLENKCCVIDCDNEYNHLIDSNKYCNTHIPTEEYGTIIKRLCKYCDIKEDSTFVCKDCKKIQNKKEWAIVRYLRKAIDTKFEYNSSKMLQGCSKKRPDIYFELPTHCVIVEIDENQHNSYEDSCECARINEIVNGIGGKTVIIIRYNPDIVKNNGKQINVSQCERINLLTKTIKDELIMSYDLFFVKIIQLYYNDNYDIYQPIKNEIITDKVCI